MDFGEGESCCRFEKYGHYLEALERLEVCIGETWSFSRVNLGFHYGKLRVYPWETQRGRFGAFQLHFGDVGGL